MPLTGWLAARLRAHPAARPFVLGINGPQGAGKSTLAASFEHWGVARGLRWATLSIDDLYLTHDEQSALAAAHPGDPLLAVRGGPGTHDIALGSAVLAALGGAAGHVALPRYDKGAFDGRGDRRPKEQWPEVALPVDVVVLEGWMLGFSGVGAAAAGPSLARADAALAAYAAWTGRLDAMIQLRVGAVDTIRAWRIEAEARRRAAGEGGMTPEAAAAYIERFLPFYEVYPDHLARHPPVPAAHRVVWIGPDRRPCVTPRAPR